MAQLLRTCRYCPLAAVEPPHLRFEMNPSVAARQITYPAQPAIVPAHLDTTATAANDIRRGRSRAAVIGAHRRPDAPTRQDWQPGPIMRRSIDVPPTRRALADEVIELESAPVKLFGRRPHLGRATRTGPASEKLQGTKPRV